MRKVVIDIEVTGIHPELGDRVIEFAAVEIIDGALSQNYFHTYINPERESEPEALALHGLTTQFLADKPTFAELADKIQAFVAESEVIGHNAGFDMAFLDCEFQRAKARSFSSSLVKLTDTLEIARRRYPGQSNSLDALCDRLGIAVNPSTPINTLMDAQLVALIYLELVRR